MGCDIRFIIERKECDNGTWEFAEEVEIERDYDLFTALAGVRACPGSEIKVISQPKGIPSDTSDFVRYLMDSVDSHSHSWLSLKELLSYDWRENNMWLIQFSHTVISKMVELADGDLNSVRASFAFDN